MSEDYAKGFKDGFAAGLEEGKKLNNKTYTDGFIEGMKVPQPYNPNNPNPSWPPHWPYATCDVSNVFRGAVGSEVSYSNGAAGANGPSGKYDGPEYHNKVWINGTWADLGG